MTDKSDEFRAALQQLRDNTETSLCLRSLRDFMDDSRARQLATELASNTKLTDLDLGFCKGITDAGWTNVMQALAVQSALTKLGLYNCEGLGDAGATGLGRAIQANTKLTDLDLGSCEGITDAGWTDVMQALAVQSALTKLRLIGCAGLGDAGATGLGRAIKANTKLTDLNLGCCKGITDAGCTNVMQALAVQSALTKLSLYSCEGLVNTGALVRVIQANTKLTDLDLGECKGITDAGWTDVMQALAVQSALTKLGLFNCEGLGDAGATGLGRAIKASTSLQTLYAPCCRGIGHAGGTEVLKALAGHPSVTNLDLQHSKNMCAGFGAAEGKALAANTTLTALDLKDSGLSETGAAEVFKALAVNTTLTSLALNSKAVGDAGATGLGRVIKANTTLKRLDLSSWSEVGGAGWTEVIKALAVNATLEHLDLGFNTIGDAGATGLKQVLTANTTLTDLGLVYCKGVSTAGASHVMQALAVNTTLTSLNLHSWEVIDHAVALEMTKALTANVALKSLNLYGCKGIDDTVAPDMIKMLGVNTSLTKLDLRSGGITDQTHLSQIEEALRHNEAEATRKKETEQLELSGMIPWFESVGLTPQDAKDVALACVRKKFFNVLSLCSMPEKELCKALDVLPIGLRQFVPMIIKAARSSKATRERATLTPSNATTTEWMRNVGFDDVTAAHVGSVLEASHMRSKGLVLAQDPAELELVAGKLPAPAKHAFLAVVRDARSQQQFTLGHPPRLITDKWCAPVKPYFIQLGIFDDETIRQIEIACGNDDLKIRCLWSLFAMEGSELRSALTAAKLPLIVQKTLINGINVEADRSETQWVIDTTSPGDGGQLMIYARKEWEEKENQKLEEKQEAEERKQEEERKQQEEKRKQEAQTYEPTGCCGFGNKCRKCGKRKSDHFTPALYCIDSQTRGSSSQDTCTRRGRAKVTPVQEGEVEDIDHVGEDVKGPTPGDDSSKHHNQTGATTKLPGADNTNQSDSSDVSNVGDDADGAKFAGRVGELTLGSSSEAAAGLLQNIGLGNERVLGMKLKQGLEAIELEVAMFGSPDDLDNLHYIVNGVAQNWDHVPKKVKEDIAKGWYHGGKLERDDYDRGNKGKTLQHFVNHPSAKLANLSVCHVVAVRLYTTSSYPLFNGPLRKGQCPHPLQMCVYYLDQALRQLRSVGAESDDFIEEVLLYRGMMDTALADVNAFLKKGGVERAPMSTTTDRATALKYAKSQVPLMFKYRARAMAKGVSIRFLSVYPGEEEFLYPPFTFLLPCGAPTEEVMDGMKLTMVEIKPSFS